MSSKRDSMVNALGPREVIARAVQLLKDRHHVSDAEAFEMLVRGSSDSHEKVREVAAAIVLRSTEANSLNI